jgi:hypothetical protein
MFDRFEDIFDTAGWRVVTLKYGKWQREAFARTGGNEKGQYSAPKATTSIGKCPLLSHLENPHVRFCLGF